MRDLTKKEMTEVSGGFFSFFDRSNLHSQNGDPTRTTVYTRNVHTPDGNGGYAGTEAIGTPTSPTGLGSGGATFTLGLNTPDFGAFETVDFEPVDLNPEASQDAQIATDDTLFDSEEFNQAAKDFLAAAEAALEMAKADGVTTVRIADDVIVPIDEALRAISEAGKVFDRVSVITDVTAGDYRSAIETITDIAVGAIVASAVTVGAAAIGFSGGVVIPIAAAAGIVAGAVVSVPFAIEQTFEFITQDIPNGFNSFANDIGQLEHDLRNDFLIRGLQPF